MQPLQKLLELQSPTLNQFKNLSFPMPFTKFTISAQLTEAASGRQAEMAMVVIPF